jgi:phosphatidylinositol glycan class B
VDEVAVLRAALPGTRVSRAIGAAIAVTFLTAWFNGGYLHPDEHWQILQFAWHKLGHAPASSLPWEFAAQMRAGFQPWVAAGLIAGFERVGLFNPFFTAFLLRLAAGLLGLWVALRLCRWLLPTIQGEAYRRLAFYGTLFLWLEPILRTRFSAESVGGSLAFLGVTLLIDAEEARREAGRADAGRMSARAILLAAAAGLALGFGFFSRVQMAPAIAGAVLWLLVYRRGSWRPLAVAGAAFLVASACNLLIDRWLYDAWVVTPYRYFTVNLIDGKASGFGTPPWWVTFAPALLLAAPPFDVLVLLTLLSGVWTCRRHPGAWMILPFVIAHAAIAHKEPRFMAPVVVLIPLALAETIERLPARVLAWIEAPRRSALRTFSIRFVALANFAAMAFFIFQPASGTFPLIEKIAEYGRSGPVRVLVVPDRPAQHALDHWQAMSFYWPPSVTEQLAPDGLPLQRLADAPAGTLVLVLQKGPAPPSSLSGARFRLVPLVVTAEQSLLRYNVLNRIPRRDVWTLWEVLAGAASPRPGP